MDFFINLATGFGVALTTTNLAYCFVGCLLGTLIGVLPGLGPSATIAMLLPLTYTLDPTTSLIMLAGIYYGAQYGGSTTAILVNLPGEVSSVVTAIDGHQMAKQGRAGVALTTAALGSFVAGTIATLAIAMFAPLLAHAALRFGAADYFSLMVLGLLASVALAHGSLLKALIMVVLGLLIGMVGTDVTSGTRRLTFGLLELTDGIDLITVAMGIYGLGEILSNLETQSQPRTAFAPSLRTLLPSRADMKAIVAPVLRGTAFGSVLGVLPGSGSVLGTFVAYSFEKKVAKDPSRFGKGAIEGVAAPESANNAGAQTSFIPMLTLGLPSTVTMALMIGALTIQGIQPGPGIIVEQPVLFWGLVVSMWIGNLMLVVLNLPLIGVWTRLLSVPYRMLFPAIMVFCAIGVYTLNNTEFNIYILALFGLMGYLLRVFDFEPAPLLLGIVLGPMLEKFLRRALTLSQGDPSIFVERPISATLLAIAVIIIAVSMVPSIRRRKQDALQAE